jgi:hypothetical protein
MISKLSDEDALDILMTSDFDDNYSPKEMKEMLLKYRYFYRILHSRHERISSDKNFEIERLSDKISTLENSVTSLQVDMIGQADEIISLKSRKLSWKERFTGKIITNDEDKGI